MVANRSGNPWTSPTLNRRRLALTLRKLRENKGMRAVDASHQAEHEGSWLSKIERGEVRPGINDVKALLELYDVSESHRPALIEMARGARKRGWWQPFSGVLPDWFVDFVGLESNAIVLRNYECQVVPGLLQTEAYARATIAVAPVPVSPDETDRLVALRMERQKNLERPDLSLLVVMDESVILQQIGGPGVMREQVEHLAEAAERPNVDIQIKTFTAGVGLDGSFVVMDFPSPPEGFPAVTAYDRVVYVDTLVGALWHDDPQSVAAYTAAFEQLGRAAQATSDTAERLRKLAKAMVD
jgi:transcriptional regulator with XRE-family HTH domain